MIAKRVPQPAPPSTVLAANAQPHFDRTVKPVAFVADDIVRNFHPEPGAKVSEWKKVKFVNKCM